MVCNMKANGLHPIKQAMDLHYQFLSNCGKLGLMQVEQGCPCAETIKLQVCVAPEVEAGELGGAPGGATEDTPPTKGRPRHTCPQFVICCLVII